MDVGLQPSAFRPAPGGWLLIDEGRLPTTDAP